MLSCRIIQMMYFGPSRVKSNWTEAPSRPSKEFTLKHFPNREKVWVCSLSESDSRTTQLWGFTPHPPPWPQAEPSGQDYKSVVEFINGEAGPVREQ